MYVDLIKADKGVIKVLGQDITTLNTAELNKLESNFLFQNAALYVTSQERI
jgi:ABC-type transporter Mla maintaining outer membrane lipid asymmetry ATPase subunit MlaF